MIYCQEHGWFDGIFEKYVSSWFVLTGCGSEKEVKRAVFAWEGAEESDRQILDKYQIDTIFMDINHYSSLSNYNIFVLTGDPSWGLDEMQEVVEEAKGKKQMA